MKIKRSNNWKVTLVLYITTQGFSFVLSDGPEKILDYGTKRIIKRNQSNYQKTFENILSFYQPEVVILQGIQHKTGKYSKRTIRFINSLIELAEQMKLKVYRYSRTDINHAFTELGYAVTKYEIARSLSEWYPDLQKRLPHKRRAYDSVAYNMAIFDAFSLLVSHYFFVN